MVWELAVNKKQAIIKGIERAYTVRTNYNMDAQWIYYYGDGTLYLIPLGYREGTLEAVQQMPFEVQEDVFIYNGIGNGFDIWENYIITGFDTYPIGMTYSY